MPSLSALLAVLPNLLYRLLAKTGLPKSVQDVIVHVLLVFVGAFVAQMAGAPIVALVSSRASWPTLAALVVSAAAAGGIAVWHYVSGLIPNAFVKASSGTASSTTASSK